MTVTLNETTTHDLFEELEREARARSVALENASPERRLPAGFTSMFYPPTLAEEKESQRLNAAMQLADTWDVYVALARKQSVPRHRLNAAYLAVLERWPSE